MAGNHASQATICEMKPAWSPVSSILENIRAAHPSPTQVGQSLLIDIPLREFQIVSPRDSRYRFWMLAVYGSSVIAHEEGTLTIFVVKLMVCMYQGAWNNGKPYYLLYCGLLQFLPDAPDCAMVFQREYIFCRMQCPIRSSEYHRKSMHLARNHAPAIPSHIVSNHLGPQSWISRCLLSSHNLRKTMHGTQSKSDIHASLLTMSSQVEHCVRKPYKVPKWSFPHKWCLYKWKLCCRDTVLGPETVRLRDYIVCWCQPPTTTIWHAA